MMTKPVSASVRPFVVFLLPCQASSSRHLFLCFTADDEEDGGEAVAAPAPAEAEEPNGMHACVALLRRTWCPPIVASCHRATCCVRLHAAAPEPPVVAPAPAEVAATKEAEVVPGSLRPCAVVFPPLGHGRGTAI